MAVDILSFAFPIRRAARQVLPANWSEEKLREHLSGGLKDQPIPELNGKSGRDLLKIIGNTVRRRFGDDVWAARLMEEVDRVGYGGLVIIDDLRFPGELRLLRDRGAFCVRLVTAQPDINGMLDDPEGFTEGQLWGHRFDAEVPAKGLVPQAVLEMLVETLWHERLGPMSKQVSAR